MVGQNGTSELKSLLTDQRLCVGTMAGRIPGPTACYLVMIASSLELYSRSMAGEKDASGFRHDLPLCSQSS